MAKQKKQQEAPPPPVHLERKLFQAADKLRRNIDAAEYKHVALGLLFLKYISDCFTTKQDELRESAHETGANPENKDEYTQENIFWVPPKARWQHLQDKAAQATIGKIIDEAMEAIEKENEILKGILPKVFSRPNIPSSTLGELIELFSDIQMGRSLTQPQDILGKIYEYFLGEFALAEGKQGGQFYTPPSIVKLLVEMIEPYKGRVYDPCCGSGGMFVSSEKFIREHQGKVKNISIYGQESNQTTYRLCRMNLAIRHIDGSQVKWNSNGSFLEDEHPGLKADFILANPPFNDSDWGGKQLTEDIRWKYGVPPVGSANFAWVQHFIHHLSPKGVAGFVLSNGSLTSKIGQENIIRRNIVEAGLVDCIVNLPDKLFLNTGIPACLWFLSKKRDGFNGVRKRKNKILFVNANNLGHLVTRRNRDLSDDDIKKIADTYHHWRNGDRKYRDIPGFCASVATKKVQELDYILNPGRYVGIAEEEQEHNLAERFAALKSEYDAQVKEEKALSKRISKSLERVKFHD